MPTPLVVAPTNYVGHGSNWRTVVCLRRDITIRLGGSCANCKATHAIIPSEVVPYKDRSEAFALGVFLSWARGMSGAESERCFGITENTRRRIMADTRRRAIVLLACGAE